LKSSTSPAISAFGLARLIAPVSREEFADRHWEREPLIIRRDEPAYYDQLMTVGDVDGLLATSNVGSAYVQVVRAESHDRRERANAAEGGLEDLYQQYRAGSTIVLVFLHERCPSLQALCRSLAAETSAAIQVNAYLTPPGEQGLQLHYDKHDVFVLQIAGSKHWRVYGSPTRLPLAEWPPRPPDTDPGDPVQDVTLQAGDLVYLPRGFVHSAVTEDSPSVHLTVGVKPITWAAVMRGAVEAAFERDASLRGSLPLGFAADDETRTALTSQLSARLKAAFDARALDDAVAAAYASGRANRPPALAGHLEDLATPVQLNTRLWRRPDADAVVRVGPGEAVIEFHGKRVSVPAHAGAALRFVNAADAPFTAADLPGRLSPDGALVLVRRLLREGLLTARPAWPEAP